MAYTKTVKTCSHCGRQYNIIYATQMICNGRGPFKARLINNHVEGSHGAAEAFLWCELCIVAKRRWERWFGGLNATT